VSIPGSVTNIGNGAFQSCASLTNLVIPPRVVTLEPYAFALCQNLATARIAATVMNLDNTAFFGCTKLASLFFEGNEPLAGSNTQASVSFNLLVY
jgi:hypothetical protein